MTLGTLFLTLAAVCFGGLTVAEHDYPHWAWLLPAGLLLLALGALFGGVVVWRRRAAP